MMAAIRITLEKYLLRVVMDFLPNLFGAIFFQTDMLYAQTGAGVNKYF